MIQNVTLRNLKDLSDLFEEAGISVEITDETFLQFSKKLAVNMKGMESTEGIETTGSTGSMGSTKGSGIARAIAKTLVEFSKAKDRGFDK